METTKSQREIDFQYYLNYQKYLGWQPPLIHVPDTDETRKASELASKIRRQMFKKGRTKHARQRAS